MRWDFDLYFLMLSDMKPFFMYLLVICMSSLTKYLFSTSAHLKKIFVFFCYWVMSSFREGNGNPLQYSCLENLMGGGAW